MFLYFFLVIFVIIFNYLNSQTQLFGNCPFLYIYKTLTLRPFFFLSFLSFFFLSLLFIYTFFFFFFFFDDKIIIFKIINVFFFFLNNRAPASIDHNAVNNSLYPVIFGSKCAAHQRGSNGSIFVCEPCLPDRLFGRFGAAPEAGCGARERRKPDSRFSGAGICFF
jgi:hypothetical protein